MQIELYYAPLTCSMVPFIALTEAGAAFTVHTISFRENGHHSEAYARLNPKRQVPTLLVDGTTLTENVAIQLWIARHCPGASLLPAGEAEYQAISLMAWCASGIHPFITPNRRPERYCDLPGSAESVRRCAHAALHDRFRIADERLAGRAWFFDHFTLADAYFFWCFRRATQFDVDTSRYGHCTALFERVLQRPSVRKLLAFEAQALAAEQASG